MERHDADMDGERVEKKESIINEETKEVRRNNVSELVAKSKKAALSLWTLLHAKVRPAEKHRIDTEALCQGIPHEEPFGISFRV